MLSDQNFRRAQQLASSMAGIQLVARHRELLERRGRRAGIQDAAAFDLLLACAEAGQLEAKNELLSLITTRFTGFFRHPAQFALAAEHLRDVAAEHGSARIWSVAAATGEEPYSLAIVLIETFRCENPPVNILASDIEVGALENAAEGEYSEAALKSIDPSRRERFFARNAANGRHSLIPAVRRMVTFRPLNLADPQWPIEGPFDVVFCRNVIMYLEESRRERALTQVASLLAPDGLLMMDPAENTGNARHLFTPVSEGVYRRGGAIQSAPSSSGHADPFRTEL
jgi:chemotaxis protein methyltransferase CheR